jgi:hypothetical protein
MLARVSSLGGLVLSVVFAANAAALDLGDYFLRENGHSGWVQTNLLITAGNSHLSFDWGFSVLASGRTGSPGYVVWQRLSVGYDNRVLNHGPYPDNGFDERYVWSQQWHFVGAEGSTIPADGFLGHEELDLGALEGRTVSLWFCLDYVGNDSANDSAGTFHNISMVPEPGCGGLLGVGLIGLLAKKLRFQR